MFQNLIKNLLVEKLRWTSWRLNFWRTTDKAEVDFVIDKGNELIPIEVKYSEINRPVVKRSLRSFIDKYSPRRAFVINKSYSERMLVNNTEVIFLPFYNLVTTNIFD